MEGVVVAAGEEGADVEAGWGGGVSGPAEAGLAAGDEDFLGQGGAVGEGVGPGGPGVPGEGLDAVSAVGVGGVGGVVLAGDGGWA